MDGGITKLYDDHRLNEWTINANKYNVIAFGVQRTPIINARIRVLLLFS